MSKNFLHFIASRSDLTDEQVGEELLPMVTGMAKLHLGQYRFVPTQPVVDDTPPVEGSDDPDRPEGYNLFVKTLQALETHYPFRAAVLQLQTLLRILMVSCEQKTLHTLSAEDYSLLLNLLHELDELSTSCSNCDLGGERLLM